MNKDEMVELRKTTVARVENLRRLGDYSADARDNRANAEAILLILEHMLERAR